MDGRREQVAPGAASRHRRQSPSTRWSRPRWPGPASTRRRTTRTACARASSPTPTCAAPRTGRSPTRPATGPWPQSAATCGLHRLGRQPGLWRRRRCGTDRALRPRRRANAPPAQQPCCRSSATARQCRRSSRLTRTRGPQPANRPAPAAPSGPQDPKLSTRPVLAPPVPGSLLDGEVLGLRRCRYSAPTTRCWGGATSAGVPRPSTALDPNPANAWISTAAAPGYEDTACHTHRHANGRSRPTLPRVGFHGIRPATTPAPDA